MPHNHPTDREIRPGRLIAATVLNFVITLAEVVGGILSGSLSLISDALHNLSDGLAVLIAYFANRISKRPHDERKTFGYKRIEILAAFVNGIVLIAVSIYLFYEAIQRFIEPRPVEGSIMFAVALVGLLANLIAVWLLRRDSSKNINIRAAYLHLLSDTLSSVAVIVGGLLIIFFDMYWVDPVITILIGLYILKETWQIVRQTVDILMQSSPSGIDLKSVKSDLETLPGILNIHHIHAWNLDDHSAHFECHVDLDEDIPLSQAEKLHKEISKIMAERYNVSHITIQFEHHWCDDKNMIHQ